MVFTYTRTVKSSGIKVNGAHNEKDTNRLLYACAGLLIISAVVAGIGLDTTENQASIADTGDVQAENRPNILLIGSDGLNADAMSVYGSRWDTTPTLRALAETFLVAENAFSNSANTAGSVVSVMTSKLPTQTRVLYPPDILTGLNAYQHLPGILKSKGYRTVEFGSSYYVDAYSLNIQYGFDMVNNRSQSESKPGNLGRELGFENTVYFANKLVERITARLLHIFYLGAMPNPYRTITKPIPSIEDNEKVNQLLDIVDDSEVPVFIHAHLLGTHGGYFSPKNRVFSAGVAQTKEWMPEYYADAILAFDRNIGRIIDHLQASGEYQNTILIIYTDHNERYRTKQRVPLIIHFPGDEYAGRIATPSQNLDIAPTILDYLGITQPDWMSGNSLLSGGAETNRLIFSAGTLELKQNEQDIFMLDPARNKPPFYQFSWINIIDCQKWYAFNLATLTWTFGQVANYVKPCDHLLSLDEIKLALKERLTLDGFDTSNLP